MRYVLLLLIGAAVSPFHAIAQGCSDAGVCTAGPIGEIPTVTDSTATEEEHRHYARMTFSYAIGERATTVLQAIPEIGFGITDRLGVQLRVPYMTIEGDLGRNSGVGDPILTTSYAFIKEDHRRLDAMVGVKLNSNNATSRDDRLRSLPMPYQTGLGTTDILVGINYRYKRWTGALAWQHVLVDENMNGFAHDRWSEVPAALAYFESGGLIRADDAVARIQYAFKLDRLVLQPGILAIYHLSPDEREEFGTPRPIVRSIDNTQGLTLNLTADLRYKLSRAWWLEASVGSPLVVREVRPDGLTRALVANMGLRFAF